jgi:cell division protein FtsB
MSKSNDYEFYESLIEQLKKENEELKQRVKELENLIYRLRNDIDFLSK